MRRLVFTLVVLTGLVAGCGGGGGSPAATPTASPAVGVSTPAVSATAVPVSRATSLPLQPNAPAVGPGGGGPAERVVLQIGLSEQEAGRVAAACAQSTAIAPGTGCLAYLASLGSPCSARRPICATVGVYGGRYVLTIADTRPGSPLCAGGPGGLCFQLPVDAGSIGRLASAAASAAAGASPTPSVSPPPATPSVPATTPTPATSPAASPVSPAPTA